MEYSTILSKTRIERKDYQEEGVKWMLNLETRMDLPHSIRGGFIADEMGLGKTIMCITTFLSNFVNKTLIVVPPILLAQWSDEIYKFTKHRALVYHGSGRDTISLKRVMAAPIVLTTYALIARRKGVLVDVVWDRVVFDEAHHLRNKNNRHEGAKQLKAKIVWLVSGTPVQNKIKDFYNLCSVLKMPVSYYTNPENLSEIVKTFIMKRTKKQCNIMIPDVDISQIICPWKNKEERKMSESIHKMALRSMERNKLPIYLQARQFCVLPSLCKPRSSDICDAFKGTSKLDVVLETIISRRYNGNGKLVFCHFKGEIDFIAAKLRENGVANICIFDGRMSQIKRVQNIHKAFDVILLQIQTGCEGLNLQANYSEIYFVSPNWNPFVEQQAVARCHRIGQTKPVQVFSYFMDGFGVNKAARDECALDSLDAVIFQTQGFKESVVQEVFELVNN